MDISEFSLSQFANAFPEQLEFYHLGTVEQHSVPFEFENAQGVAFRIFGNLSDHLNAFIIILFHQELDHSTYSELGNLLASRFVTQIQKQSGIELTISPPQTIDAKRIQQLQLQRNFPVKTQTFIRRTYAHFFENSVIPVETLVVSLPSEEVGYA